MDINMNLDFLFTAPSVVTLVTFSSLLLGTRRMKKFCFAVLLFTVVLNFGFFNHQWQFKTFMLPPIMKSKVVSGWGFMIITVFTVISNTFMMNFSVNF